MEVPFRGNAKGHEDLRDLLDKLQFVGKLRQEPAQGPSLTTLISPAFLKAWVEPGNLQIKGQSRLVNYRLPLPPWRRRAVGSCPTPKIGEGSFVLGERGQKFSRVSEEDAAGRRDNSSNSILS